MLVTQHTEALSLNEYVHRQLGINNNCFNYLTLCHHRSGSYHNELDGVACLTPTYCMFKQTAETVPCLMFIRSKALIMMSSPC